MFATVALAIAALMLYGLWANRNDHRYDEAYDDGYKAGFVEGLHSPRISSEERFEDACGCTSALDFRTSDVAYGEAVAGCCKGYQPLVPTKFVTGEHRSMEDRAFD